MLARARRFSFTSEWQVPYPLDDVAAAIIDLEFYPLWWRQIRAVAALGPDDAWVICRSRLPYNLNLFLHAESRRPPELRVGLDGDLRGMARYRLWANTFGTQLSYRQDVEVSGRLLTAAAVLARPLLVRNHDAMMRDCRAGLSAWLATAPSGSA